ncbi:hypothetical protein GCM10023149_37890 [Mucilaginibacter gynuensis]|uniref:DUF4099 domain-containing protein n=1 Tax=Mucilaginibacter gynuensis TaxID=1302236 RepID=A0ABP8GZ48_9SPHI
MNLMSFNENDLPIPHLKQIGLLADGKMLLDVKDLKTLLSGRRTTLIELKNIETGNTKIKMMNAKLSLQKNVKGEVDLLIHPVYRKSVAPIYLDESEIRQLEKGKIGSLLRLTIDDKGHEKELLIEYDKETREFITSDTAKILVPDMINDELLTPAQKDAYRKGREVELADKTRFNFSGADIYGIRSNKLALVASVLVDGGVSYMLYTGLNAIFNKKRDLTDAAQLSDSYYRAASNIRKPPIPENNNLMPLTRSNSQHR